MQTTGDKTRRRRNTHQVDPNVYRANTNLVAYPYFSLEERDRRWSAVRESMEADRIDCLIVPPSAVSDTLLGASGRYLTQIGGGTSSVSVVFPLNREPAAILTDAATWSSLQPWCTDLREPVLSHCDTALGKLKDVGLRRRRIGVIGLDVRHATDEIPYGYLAGLGAALPRVTFVDFTDQLAAIRERKSGEEVAFLRQSATIVEKAFAASLKALRSGASQREVEIAAISELCRSGSDLPLSVRLSSDIADSSVPDAGRPLQESTTAPDSDLTSEIEAAWGGYRVRAWRPLVGTETRAADLEIHDLAVEFWRSVVARIRPGQTVRHVMMSGESIATRFASSGLATGSATCAVEIHPCGLGADTPTSIERASPTAGDRLIVPGACFSLGVTVVRDSRFSRWMQPVQVTDRGAHYLLPRHQKQRAIDS